MGFWVVCMLVWFGRVRWLPEAADFRVQEQQKIVII